MISITTILALVSAITICQSVPVLIPSGKELIYDYYAMINVGTYKPATFTSQFILEGKLHVQKHDDHNVMMKLSDLTYKLHNGKMDHFEEQRDLVALPLAKDAEDMLKTFVMTYDDHGKIKTIIADKTDPKFSRDMKKGIGSIWQIDMKEIKLDSKSPYTFITHENSLYGESVVRYQVMPEHDELVVDKMIDIMASPSKKVYTGSLNAERMKELEHRDPITVGSTKKYFLKKDDTGCHIRKLRSQGTTLAHLLRGFSESQFMLVNQTMTLKEMIPIANQLAMPQEKLEEDLTFKLEMTSDCEGLVDLSYGRCKLKMEDYETLAYKIIDEIITHMRMNHLTLESPDLKTGQAVTRLKFILGMMDLKTLERMFTTMQAKTGEENVEKFEIFEEMLPLLGTRASVLLIHKLIKEQKIQEAVAVEMLTTIPFHIRMPSEKLLTEIEDMMNMENVSPIVNKMAALCFASMINKVYTHFMIETDATLKTDKLDKYIEQYMELLKNSKDYSSQYLYMNALYNIRVGKVRKLLEPYVTGEATQNRHLRFLAMCASFSEAVKDRDLVLKIYWPIFIDTSLHLELRAGAYHTIMGTKPSRSKLMSIYWILKNDPCPELYHMHYTYLRSMMYTTNPSLQEYKTMATELLNFMRKPYFHTLSGTYMMDARIPEYGFEGMTYTNMLSTNTSKTMYLKIDNNMYNIPLTNIALWIKIDGMDPSVLRKAKVPLENGNFMLEELLRILMSLKDQKNLHIEFALLRNDKVILLEYADHTNMDKLQEHSMALMNMNTMSIEYKQSYGQIMVNDLGFPTIIQISMPIISKNDFDMTDDKLDGMNVKSGNLKIVTSHHSIHRLAFYNPIPDIWQGIARFQANDMITAWNFKIAMSKDFKLKMTLNKMDDDTTDKFAIRHYATSMTYVMKDVNNDLQKSSKKSEHFSKVSKGEDYRKSKILFEHDCPHTGQLLQIGVFDTKQHISRRAMVELMQDFSQRYLKNYQTMPMGRLLLTIQQAMVEMMISPKVGTFGFLVRVTPSKKYPVDHIDMSLRFTHENIFDKDSHLPNTKMNKRITWSTKSKDNKVIRNWDMNAILDMNPGHTLNNFKVHFSMTCPEEKEFKMCVTGMRKWLNNKMIGHLNITMGHTDDSKTCTDNEGLIEIDMKGGLSNMQQDLMDKQLTYDECLPEHMHEPLMKGLQVDYEENIECTMKHTSIRKFEYDIKTTGLSETCKDTLRHIRSCMKGMMYPHYSFEKNTVPIDENMLKVTIDYPLIGNEINMKVLTKDFKHKLTEAPNSLWKWFGFHPESYHYTFISKLLYKMGLVESCMIVDHHIINDNYEVIEISDKDWMHVVWNNPDLPANHTLDIFVKRMEGRKDMGLRIKMDEKILEIIPEGNNYKITWDNKPLTVEKKSYQDEDLFSIGMLNDKHSTLIMHLYKFKLYVDFDGEQMRIDKFKLDEHLVGECFVN